MNDFRNYRPPCFVTDPHCKRLKQSESNKIDTPTYICAQLNYFRFVDAILETVGNQLGQPHTVGIHPKAYWIDGETRGMILSGIECNSISLTRSEFVKLTRKRVYIVALTTCVIRRHTTRSGDVGPDVCDRLPKWWLITSGGVSERFPVGRSGLFDEFRQFDVGLLASTLTVAAANQKWFLWAIPSVFNGQKFRTDWDTDINQTTKNHFGHTENRSRFCLESTLHSRNTSSKYIQTEWAYSIATPLTWK